MDPNFSTGSEVRTFGLRLTSLVPGVQKLLIRVVNVEDKSELLNKRVEKLETRDCVSSGVSRTLSAKKLLNSESLKEIESRKLNKICLNLPESN